MRKLCTALVALALCVPSASADEDSEHVSHDVVRAKTLAGEILPLSAIVSDAREKFAAELIDVEFERDEERYIYELVMLSADGAISELYYDAATGVLLKIEVEDDEAPGLPSRFYEDTDEDADSDR